MRRVWLGWVAVVGGLLIAGCGSEPGAEIGAPEAEGYRVSRRLLGEEPAERWTGDRLDEDVVQVAWDFGRNGIEADWQLRGWAEIGAPEEQGVRLVAERTNPVMLVESSLDASQIDVLEVRAEGLERGQIELLWAGAGGSWHESRRMSLRASPTGTYRFRVGSHSGWTGTVGRLRLGFLGPTPPTVRIATIRGVREVLHPDRSDSVVRRPWAVTLGQEERPALLVPPGIPRHLSVEAGERLRLAFGLPASASAAVRFRADLVAGDRTLPIVNRVIEPGSDDADRWWEVTSPLPASGSPELVLRTSTEGTLRPGDGLPAFANPMVLKPTPSPPPSLVLVSLDTLRADRIGAYGNLRGTTPHLDAFSRREATLFARCGAPSPWTLPSHLSMLTGLDAVHHGVNRTHPVPARFDLLAEILQAGGYETLGVTGGGYVHPRWGFGQGFDLYGWVGPGTDMSVSVDRVSHLLEGRHAPWFLFLHSYQVHDPLRPRPPWVRRWGRPDPSTVLRIRGDRGSLERPVATRWARVDEETEIPAPADLAMLLYDGNLALADHEVGRLLRILRRGSQSPETVVAVTSDHGQMLGEHDLAGHSFLFEENLRVPLLMAGPTVRRGAVVDELVRLVDVMPTLLDLAGLASPNGLDGRSLAPWVRGEAPPASREVVSLVATEDRHASSLTTDGVKYVLRQSRWPPREAVYRLKTDPSERHPVSVPTEEELEVRQRLIAQLIERLPGLRIRLSNGSTEPIRVTLQAPLDARTLKALDPQPPPVEWIEGGFRTRLPPGRRVVLHVPSDAAPARLAGSLTPATGSSVSFEVDVTALIPGAVVGIDATGRRISSDPDTGIALQWHRTLGEEGEADLDAELTDQLRDLGYLP